MELASGFARGGDAALFMAAKAHSYAPVVCDQLAADHRIPDLHADGLGHLGVAGATLGADAALKLGMGFAALGAQPDPDDLLCPRLHLWLYGWKKQDEDYKFDRRGPAKNARIFLWNDQYWDNVTYALLSGVTVWTFYDTHCLDGLRQWMGADDHGPEQSDLVFCHVPVVACCAVLPFLLAAPRTAHPMDLQARTFCASP